jgi:hypothetical protein
VILFAPDRAMRDLLAFALRIDGHLLRTASDFVELYSWLQGDTSDGAEGAHTVVVVATEYDRSLEHLWRQCQTSGDFTLIFVAATDDSTVAWPQRLGATHVVREPDDIDALRRAVQEAAVGLPFVRRSTPPRIAYTPPPTIDDEESTAD